MALPQILILNMKHILTIIKHLPEPISSRKKIYLKYLEIFTV